ncbi:carboxypeptidase-like regulatory domain-containing protein [uncultured Draconibacterium sp.]|uniref:carboxypeptidase-like regulatory domain-containing protein n=1 Tax=uncultured Draconibacterium sp. TaxID=1573823 RepID=UPI0025D9F2E6|nr:carboxypeptidase-like regulatory domain-containing protein [uncultured Draconibacterium sp.]
MKNTLVGFIISCLSLVAGFGLKSHAQQLGEIKISGSYHNQALSDFVKDLEKNYNLRVYYKEAWLANYTINKQFNNTPLLQALNNLFFEHDLTYEFFQDNGIVIFRRSADTRSKFDDYTQTLVVGNPMNLGRYKTALLKGRVVDGKDGAPLVGAVVYCNKHQKGTTTANDGTFELDLPTGDVKLNITYIGFEGASVNIRLIEDGSADFQLFEESHNIDEVTVLGTNADLPRAQMSMVQMSGKEIKQLPALMGEVDVLKGLTILAGVQTVSELSSGFNVRGGNTDQNLILVNGSPVFNSSHLFGFMSLINPDVVENVRLFKGGMPARYGERVASVMEVDFKEGNDETMRVYGGIGIINSRLAIDGPLTKNKKLTTVIGGRSSYTDWILQEIPNLELNEGVTHFYDLSGKVTYKFNQHNKISAMAYTSFDEFSTSSQSITEYGNLLGNLQVNNRFGEKFYGQLETAYSRYDYRLTDLANSKPYEAYFLDNQLEYGSFAYSFKWHPTERHNSEAGFKAVYNRISPGEITPYQDTSVIEYQKLNAEKTLDWSVFVSDEFQVLPHFSIVAGLRYNHFSNIGTPLVYLYDPNEPKSPETVIDSLQFGKNEVSASYGGLEPRLALNFDFSMNTTLKFSYQRTRQNIFQLSNNAVISPAETWKAADYHLKPLISDQLAVGVENNSLLSGIEFTTEVYYKNLQNLIEYKNGAQLIMNEYVETALVPTKGYSYGIELSARKNQGRLTGYASYVYSRTMRKNNSQFDEENLWNGDYYPSIYDKPHDFSLTATYNISRRWRFSGNFVFVSGRPTTLPEIKYEFAGENLVYYSERNKYRMPPYHRLDLSITFDENLRKKRMWKGSWTFSVYNAYGRNNPYSVYYKKTVPGESNNYTRYSLFKLSVIGIPVPSLTYNFRF